MKKILTSLTLTVLLVVSVPTTFAATSNEKLIIDGQIVVSDVQPEKINNRVMVPIRVVGENLGLDNG